MRILLVYDLEENMKMTDTPKKIVIAIDGFSSCGKSSMAKVLASEIGYIYIDSGAMYRAVTLYCIQQGLIVGDVVDQEGLSKRLDRLDIAFTRDCLSGQLQTWLNGVNVESEIRSMAVSSKVSIVSSIPFVRMAMVRRQQKIGEFKGIVMDGRDIGTTVFPDAELKIFVTASPEIRAQRRVDEWIAKGVEVSFEDVLKNVKERDFLDQNRSESPLRKADDALLLDNSYLTIEQQNRWLLEQFECVTGQQ